MLLRKGLTVRSLTNSTQRANPFRASVEVSPFHFDNPPRLQAALDGTEVLYNTYWVRFNYRGFSHGLAVKNTKVLLAAAVAAGVKRVVNVSITNPSLDSPLEYFAGKAELEQALKASGLFYAILRPAVIFGDESVQGQGLGGQLLRFVLRLAVRKSGEYGCVGVAVDAKAGAVAFYGRYGFIPVEAVAGQSDARPAPTPMFPRDQGSARGNSQVDHPAFAAAVFRRGSGRSNHRNTTSQLRAC